MYNFANRCEFFAFASACEISNFTIRNNEFAKKISVSHILAKKDNTRSP